MFLSSEQGKETFRAVPWINGQGAHFVDTPWMKDYSSFYQDKVYPTSEEQHKVVKWLYSFFDSSMH